MATTIQLNSATRLKLQKIISRPFRNIRQFWAALAVMIDQDTQHIFKGEGARKNKPGKWRSYSSRTLKTPAGTWKLRYGTDKRPLPKDQLRALKSKWGWGRVGEMRKVDWRYSASSKLLQASGLFRKSFGILKLGKDRLLYGTRHELASKIMGVRNRQVLFVTEADERRYAEQFKRWYLKGLRV